MIQNSRNIRQHVVVVKFISCHAKDKTCRLHAYFWNSCCDCCQLLYIQIDFFSIILIHNWYESTKKIPWKVKKKTLKLLPLVHCPVWGVLNGGYRGREPESWFVSVQLRRRRGWGSVNGGSSCPRCWFLIRHDSCFGF